MVGAAQLKVQRLVRRPPLSVPGKLSLFQEVRCWIFNLLPPFPFEQTAISYVKE